MRTFRLLILSVIVLSSCVATQNKTEQKAEYGEEILGVASPIQLLSDTTIVFLSDYFTKPEEVTSVSAKGLNVILDSSTYELRITGSFSGGLEVLNLTTTSASYSIPIKASREQNVKLEIPVELVSAEKVQVKGTFNGWNPGANECKNVKGNWITDFKVPKGAYEYILVADGKEMLDPANKNTVPNGMGGTNNVLQVGEKELANSVKGIGFSNGVLTLGSELKLTRAVATLYNQELETEITGAKVKVQIPAWASELDMTTLRVLTASNAQVNNEVLVPLSKGAPVMSVSDLPRSDMHKSIMYFVMVDRFYDADSTNNFPIKDERILPIANNLGGDMAGISKKIEEGYFHDLGVNTLWLSPITTNPDSAYGLWNEGVTSMFSGYHGYWPIRSKEIDYRLGSHTSFKALLEGAHDRDMNVILDYVANHVHIEHPVYKAHPEWATDLYLPDGTMNTEKWDEHRLTTWFDTHLATLDLRKPEVIAPMTDTALFWLENYELDGFRHDATKHIPEEFWRTLTSKIKTKIVQEKSRPIYQVGETYGSPELISSYVESGQLDAQFDFNLYDAAVDAFAKESTGFQNLERVLNESLRYYGAHHLMVNITGNQDRARFASYADGSVSFSEDAKLAGWTRTISNANEDGFTRMKMLTAFLHAIPGIPCIYYGDELAMPGGNDPDNRRMMLFSDLTPEQKSVKENLESLTDIRGNSMPLVYGSTEVVEASNNVLRISRTYLNKEVQFIFYKGAAELELDLVSKAGIEYKIIGSQNIVSIDSNISQSVRMKPWSFVILEAEPA